MSLAKHIIDNPVIKTRRFLIRPLHESDVHDLLEWVSDGIVYVPSHRDTKNTPNPSLQFFCVVDLTKRFHWGIQFDGKVIGELWMHLNEVNRSAKLAYRIASSYRGHGIASEGIQAIVSMCFATSELRTIWADVYDYNTASIRVLEKSGFVLKKVVSRNEKDNIKSDYYIYAIENTCY